MAVIKTNAGKVKRLKAYQGKIAALPKITHAVVGDGGKEPNGKLKVPTSNMTQLYNQLLKVPIKYEDINDFSCKFICALDSNTQADILGKDINEIGLVDSEGTLITIETFNLFSHEGFPPNSQVNLKTQLTVE